MAENSQITMEEFRRNRETATASGAGGKTVGSLGKHSSNFGKKMDHIRPPSVSAKASTSQDDKLSAKTREERSEQAKLSRDKQVEERKKKSEERKAAVEDRRRQKESEEIAKNEAMRNLLDKGSTGSKGSGRRLPSLPGDGSKDACRPRRETLTTRRVSSGSSSGDSPIHTPPGSSAGTKSSRRGLTGPSSSSTSCLSNVGSGYGRVQARSNLGASKKASSSTNNLTDKTLVTGKPTTKVKEKSVVSKKIEKSGLPKAQSTGAIHQLGHGTGNSKNTSRPKSGNKKTKSKASPVHHAATGTEQEAKLALAENRRKVREEAERKALLNKEKQEELRKQKEEDEKRLAEENAKETARQAELAKILKDQEEERATVLREEQEKVEAEKIVAELKRKEEIELTRKLELERRAKEAEKREKEEEERLQREEEERQERRKRVEKIMIRTRMTAAVNNDNAKENISQEDSLTKTSDDPSHHSPTVSEILQKVKEKSRGSPNPDSEKENEDEWFDATENDVRDVNKEKTMRTGNDASKLEGFSSENKDEDVNYSPHFVSLSLRQRDVTGRVNRNRTEADGDGRTTTRTDGDGEVSSTRSNIVSSNNSSNGEVRRRDGELWKNVEGIMQFSESYARGTLERDGAVGGDEDDEDGEEGQLWKVVEGKRDISEVV